MIVYKAQCAIVIIFAVFLQVSTAYSLSQLSNTLNDFSFVAEEISLNFGILDGSVRFDQILALHFRFNDTKLFRQISEIRVDDIEKDMNKLMDSIGKFHSEVNSTPIDRGLKSLKNMKESMKPMYKQLDLYFQKYRRLEELYTILKREVNLESAFGEKSPPYQFKYSMQKLGRLSQSGGKNTSQEIHEFLQFFKYDTERFVEWLDAYNFIPGSNMSITWDDLGNGMYLGPNASKDFEAINGLAGQFATNFSESFGDFKYFKERLVEMLNVSSLFSRVRTMEPWLKNFLEYAPPLKKFPCEESTICQFVSEKFIATVRILTNRFNDYSYMTAGNAEIREESMIFKMESVQGVKREELIKILDGIPDLLTAAQRVTENHSQTDYAANHFAPVIPESFKHWVEERRVEFEKFYKPSVLKPELKRLQESITQILSADFTELNAFSLAKRAMVELRSIRGFSRLRNLNDREKYMHGNWSEKWRDIRVALNVSQGLVNEEKKIMDNWQRLYALPVTEDNNPFGVLYTFIKEPMDWNEALIALTDLLKVVHETRDMVHNATMHPPDHNLPTPNPSEFFKQASQQLSLAANVLATFDSVSAKITDIDVIRTNNQKIWNWKKMFEKKSGKVFAWPTSEENEWLVRLKNVLVLMEQRCRKLNFLTILDLSRANDVFDPVLDIGDWTEIDLNSMQDTLTTMSGFLADSEKTWITPTVNAFGNVTKLDLNFEKFHPAVQAFPKVAQDLELMIASGVSSRPPLVMAGNKNENGYEGWSEKTKSKRLQMELFNPYVHAVVSLIFLIVAICIFNRRNHSLIRYDAGRVPTERERDEGDNLAIAEWFEVNYFPNVNNPEASERHGAQILARRAHEDFRVLAANKPAMGPCTNQEKYRLMCRYDSRPIFDHNLVRILDDHGAMQPIPPFYPATWVLIPRGITYIAAETPKPANSEAFWHLVWTHEVSTLVLLCGLNEVSKRFGLKMNSSVLYIPVKEKHQNKDNEYIQVTFGRYTITLEKMDTMENNTVTVRQLIITNSEEPGIAKTVTHYHHIAWPMYGCPRNFEGVMDILKRVSWNTNKNGQPPVLVHCSNGCGRTGTLSVTSSPHSDVCNKSYLPGIDWVLKRLFRDGNTSIVTILVNEFRLQLANAVQTPIQLIYLYASVYLHYKHPDMSGSLKLIKAYQKFSAKEESKLPVLEWE
ncbi:unnamed protein product [Caenorhabditis sp. 36 PRJEB53466]|nr:unnamed protein product [Caenorhabditis sp. 36 PRJEB53466]